MQKECDVTVEELKEKLLRVNKGVDFRKLDVENGAIILDPTKNEDIEWYTEDD